MLSQPTIKRVEKQSKDTPLQIMASFAASLAPSFSFLMMYPPKTIPTPALGTMIRPAHTNSQLINTYSKVLWSDQHMFVSVWVCVVPVYILALDAGTPNWDSINLGMKVMKAVTMAHSAVYDKLTNKNVTLLNIRTAAFGKSGERQKQTERETRQIYHLILNVSSKMCSH